MARGKKGSHIGALAGGFINGLLASLKYGMMSKHYAMMDKYYESLMNQKGDTLKTDQGDFNRGKFGHGPFGIPSKDGGRGSFMDSVADIESGNKDIYSATDKDYPREPNSRSQGFFQIDTPTWQQFAAKAGVDITKYPTALGTPREIQQKVAETIPLSRFGERTQKMLTEKYGQLDTSKPLGELALRFDKRDTQVASDEDRKYLASTSKHTDRPGDTENLNPGFASKVAATIKDARAQGLNVGLQSAFREPGQTGSTFDASGRSLHTYGLAIDFSGFEPGSADAVKFYEIAKANGLYNPYGPNNKNEWNHYQAIPYELKANSPELAALKTAYATKDQNTIWEAGNKLMGVTAAPAAAAPAAKTEEAPVPPRRAAVLPAAAKPVAKPVPTPPVKPTAAKPTASLAAPVPPTGPTVAEAQPIAPAIPPSTVAAAEPAPAPTLDMAKPAADRMTVAGNYGPGGKWGPNPPLAERAPSDQPVDITPGSNAPPPTTPAIPVPMEDPRRDMMAMGPDTGMDSGMAMGPDTGMDAGMGTMAAARGGVVQRFQGGGDVADPGASSIGMPPALAGGAQPVPPIYFNPATYAAAGAPVGKGISATSAPTFTAGAIPTLPMARGGVVKRYQGGGEIGNIGDDEIGGAMPDTSYEDMALMQRAGAGGGPGAGPNPLAGLNLHPDESQADLPAPGAIEVSNIGGFSGVGSPGGGMGRVGAGILRGPRPSMGAGAGGTRGGGAGGGLIYTEHPEDLPADSPYHPNHPANHPDLPAHTPQIMDQDGNPSSGLTSAISAGLHYIGQALGIAPDQPRGVIAGDPQTQVARNHFVNNKTLPGVPEVTDGDMYNMRKTVDPHDTLDDNMSTIAGLESLYVGLVSRGDVDNASKVAAAIMMKTVQTSIKYGDEAYKRWGKGDIQGSIEALGAAHDAIADGTIVGGHVVDDPNSPGGWAVEVSGHKLNGQELWRQVIGPRQLLGAIQNSRNGTTAWNMYEEAAGKHDPAYAQRAATRHAAAQSDLEAQRQAGREALVDKRAADKEAAAQAEQDRIQKYLDTHGGGGGEGLVGRPRTAPAARPAPPTQPPVTTTPVAPVQHDAATGGGPQVSQADLPTPGAIPASAQFVIPGSGQVVTDNAPVTTAPPDTTGTAAAMPKPPDADVGGKPAIPVTPGVAPESITPTATPAVSRGPVMGRSEDEDMSIINTQYEQAVAQNIRDIHSRHWDGAGYVIGDQVYDPPPEPQYTSDPKINAALKNRFNAQMQLWRAGALQADKAEQEEIVAMRGSLDKRFTDMRDIRKKLWDDQKTEKAATTLAGRQRQLEIDKDTMVKSQKIFEANERGAEPKKDAEMDKEKFGNPYYMMAQAFYPKLVAQPTGNDATDRNAAENVLSSQDSKLFNSETRNALANAYWEANRHSNMLPANAAAAIHDFVIGLDAQVKPEMPDPKAKPEEQVYADDKPLPKGLKNYNVVRYDVTVHDGSGNVTTFRVPADAMESLQKISLRYKQGVQAEKAEKAAATREQQETEVAKTEAQEHQFRREQASKFGLKMGRQAGERERFISGQLPPPAIPETPRTINPDEAMRLDQERRAAMPAMTRPAPPSTPGRPQVNVGALGIPPSPEPWPTMPRPDWWRNEATWRRLHGG